MLFNSFAFLFGFLPAALAFYAAVSILMPKSWRLPALLVLSFLFYGYWDWRFVALLTISILLNWAVARLFVKTKMRFLIALAIAVNLCVLGLFKYYNFFTGLFPFFELPHMEIALPLGISFFTFHHIMYLSDLRSGEAPQYDPVRYGLYIAFFPQILSGPLVRWREVMHQFEINPFGKGDTAERCARGVLLLILGLAEKTLLGDNLARIASPIFTASQTAAVPFWDAWLGTLSFTFQIYFDFAGYTDMALGTALLFGITLPANFNSPYRANSLQDFWRRWHMTLSRFLRDYLYIPLGGSRHGLAVQLWALFATMTLGGLWHGAGLNFIGWGVAHGVGLSIGVLWRRAGLSLPGMISTCMTFLFVSMSWILFRSSSFDAAYRMYGSIAGRGERGVPDTGNIVLVLGAAIVALCIPPARDLVDRFEPRIIGGVAAGVLLAITLLVLNTGENFEFIYFHF